MKKLHNLMFGSTSLGALYSVLQALNGINPDREMFIVAVLSLFVLLYFQWAIVRVLEDIRVGQEALAESEGREHDRQWGELQDINSRISMLDFEKNKGGKLA